MLNFEVEQDGQASGLARVPYSEMKESIIDVSRNTSVTKYKMTYLAPIVIVEWVSRMLLIQKILVSYSALIF